MSHAAASVVPRRSATLALAVLLLAGACGSDSPTGSQAPEPAVANVLIVLPGSVVITVTPACVVSGGPMRFFGFQSLDAQFSVRRADLTPDPLVTAADFEVQVGPAAGIVTAASTGPFSASYTPHGGGAGTITVALRHKSQNHLDFGPCSVPVQVN
jgi:hypothetical protein